MSLYDKLVGNSTLGIEISEYVHLEVLQGPFEAKTILLLGFFLLLCTIFILEIRKKHGYESE